MGSNDPASGENLLNLTDTSEHRVISEIRDRFYNKRIYTSVGGVLLSVNPFEKYGIYDESVIAQYQQLNKYAGESSSGKSFNAYQVMKYLASSRNSKVTVKHIDAITTIFNSFGCAKTVKNDDATRFGYCMDFLYHKNALSGLSLRTTLPLETIRVVSQKPGERNFNVFYELCAGMSSDTKTSYGIRDQQKFFYLTQGKVSENVRDDAAYFGRLDASLEIVGFSEEQRQIIYKTLATILHLGNMYFRQRRNTEDETEYVEVSNDVELKWAAYLLDVDMCSFAPCFTHKFTKTDEAVSKTPYSMGQALDARDALAMSLYEVVFSWILNRISLHLKCSDHNAVISVVDCYGIERYNNNGLEQLLINSVNEKLENTFVKQTFLDEIADYADEGLTFDWKVPQSLDNEIVLDLLCKKPYGLLYLIDDECKFPKASDESYLRHCNLNHLDKNVYGKAKNKERLQMSVRHSFGSTWYTVHGFVQRNKRALPGSVVKILSESQNPVISMLFRPIAAGKEGADYVVFAAQQFNTASTALVEKILGYRCLLPSDIALCQKQKEIIVDILDGQGVKFADDHRIGANYVFMRDCLANRLQTLREKTQREAAYVIQKTMRAYVARKGYLRKRQAIIRLQAGLRGWKARKECCALREQMFKNISVQTKRNRRLNAYHETLLSDVPEKKCPTALLGCLDMENNVSKEIGKSLYEPKPKAPDMKVTMDYLPMSLKSRIHTIEPVTIEKFAEENFRGHLLEPRREPILTPFLHKENDIDFRLSIEVFKLILKYMNDHTLNRNQLDDLARYIVKQGMTNPCQRDEILVQICNQMYKNPDKEASSRCCRLLLQAVGVFSPTEIVLPMLISFASQQKAPLQTQLLNTIARRMNMFENQHATRLLPASRLEMGALYGLHNAAVEVATQEGDVHVMEAHPWITSEELANRVLRHRGIGNPSGWTVEVETEKMLYCPTGAHFLHDVISEIELGKEENKRSFFHNYSSERTLPPVNKKKVETPTEAAQVKVLSPIVKRRMRQANDSRDSHYRDRSADAINSRMSRGESRRGRSQESLHVTNVTASPPSYRQTYRDVGEEEAEYCYALPVKPKSLNDSATRSPHVSHAVPRAERSADSPPELPRQPIPSSSASRFEPLPYRPPHPHHRPADSHERTNERPESMVSNPYYAQTTIPVVQYVPVMMAPQGLPVFPNQMGQPLVQTQVLMPPTSVANPAPSQPSRAFDDMARQDRIASQLSHHREPSSQSYGRSDAEDRSREYGTMKSIPRVDFDSVRSRSSVATKGGDCDSRMLNSRCDQVPSVYSTISVASRIRNMPVPNNNHDVDRFLDEVFDQVLSPHELATAEMNSHQIAATIKGGVYGPVDYETPYQRGPPPYPPNFSGNGYPQNGMDSARYDYINRENLAARAASRPTERSQSAPRYGAVERAYRHLPEDSSDSFASDVCTMREYIPSAQGTPNVQRAARPYEGAAKSSNGIYEPQQQMVFMMPMQMNASNGQMMPVLMPHGMMAQSMAPNMMYCMPPSQQAMSSPRQRRHRSVDAAPLTTYDHDELPHYYAQHNSTSSSDFHHRNQSFEASRSMLRPDNSEAPPRPLPRSPSPHKSPATERKQNGLKRLPQDAYREPVVQSTVVNSEHPTPHKFQIPEKNLVKEIRQKEQEALRKINERMKNLPPPVDHVRIYIPREPPPAQAYAVPSEPYEVVIPKNRYVETREEPRSEWVYEGEVERPVEYVERSRSPVNPPVQYVQHPSEAESASSHERPAVRYVKQPWKLTIRKEMFHPQENLDDVQVINQVFAQIISDCRKGIAYRIRAYERDDVVNILKANNIPPEMLNRQSEIPLDVKVAVVEAARKWPLYFAQVYEVVEERLDESVSVLLSIGEHGVRLLLHTPLDKENPLKPQDHFNFSDLSETTLEGDEVVCLHARNHMTIRLRTKMAPQIKAQIDKCMFGEVQKKQFVRATADYVTKQPNLLSFKKGDTIELVPLPNGEVAPSGSWLYGKIGNRYGNLPAQYVVPLDDNNVRSSSVR
ncbi:hypothetical protein Aduo_017619 [Ancylostoma duodenale]